jgi:hypothetical protein
VEDEVYILRKGDIVNIPRRFTHSFTSGRGCVFEEVSTAYLSNDSVYEDVNIRKITREQKITTVPIEKLLL